MNLPDSVKITIVEDQEKFILILQALNSVGGSLGEVPDITDVESVDLVLAILVHSRDNNFPGVHESPFSLHELASSFTKTGCRGRSYDAVPMQLANGSLLQVLLRSGDVVTGGQVRDDLLADPASGKDSRL